MFQVSKGNNTNVKWLIQTYYQLKCESYADLFGAVPRYWNSAIFSKDLQSFLGAFANYKKATISIVMSVCLSVCLRVRTEQLGSQ